MNGAGPGAGRGSVRRARRWGRAAVLAAACLCACGALAQAAATGYTQSLRDLKLSLTVTGRIDQVFAREGDRLRKGDLILQLDHKAEALEVERRTLMLKDEARLDELRQREAVLSSQIGAAQNLLQTGAMSHKQVQDEELALSNVTAERRALEIAKQRERVELDMAVEALDKRFLRAPAGGVVTKIHFHDGESVAAHEPVVVLSDASRVRFLGTLPLAEAARLVPHSRVTLRLGPDGKDQTRAAQIVFISPVADPASGLVEFVAEFDNGDGSIRPGITGRLVIAGRPAAPAAPAAAATSAAAAKSP